MQNDFNIFHTHFSSTHEVEFSLEIWMLIYYLQNMIHSLTIDSIV